MALQGGMRVDIVSATLARNRLGVAAVVFFVLAAAAPMTVVAAGATTAWSVTGVPGIPIAYLAVAGLLGLFSVGYTAMSRRIVNAGAFYSYIAQGLGRVVGVGAAFVASYSYTLMQIGLCGGLGYITAGQITAWTGIHVAWWVCALAAVAVVGTCAVLRVEINGWVLAVLLLAEITIAVVYALVDVAHPAGGHLTFTTLNPAQLARPEMGAGYAVAIAGFAGFESSAVYAEESKDPRRTVPRATYIALMVIGVLYAGASWAMSVAAGASRVVAAATGQTTDLMFNLVSPYLADVWLQIGHVLFMTSLFAAMLAFHNTGARYLYALGRERVLPPPLGHTSARHHAPVWGSGVQTVLAAAVIAVYAWKGIDPLVKLFFWWTVMAGVGLLILMVVTSIAVIVYFARPAQRPYHVDTGGWSRVGAPVLATVGLGYVLWISLDQIHVLLGTAPGSGWNLGWPVSFAVCAAAGVVWAAMLKARKPGVYDGIGMGAFSVTVIPGTHPAGVAQVPGAVR